MDILKLFLWTFRFWISGGLLLLGVLILIFNPLAGIVLFFAGLLLGRHLF